VLPSGHGDHRRHRYFRRINEFIHSTPGTQHEAARCNPPSTTPAQPIQSIAGCQVIALRNRGRWVRRIADAGIVTLALIATLTLSHGSAEEHNSGIAPPAGGITIRIANTTSLDELIGSADFPVSSVSAFNIREQRFLMYIPGAPARVNTLQRTGLTSGTLVWLKRDPTDRSAATGMPASGTVPASHSALVLPVPAPGTLTVGMSGVSSLTAFLAAQEFSPISVTMFDVKTQRFRVFVPGAPNSLNSLSPDEALPSDAVLWLRRSHSDTVSITALPASGLATVAGSTRPVTTSSPPVGPSVSSPTTDPSVSSPPAGGGSVGGSSPSTPTPTPTPTATSTPTASPTPTVSASGCEAISQTRLSLLNERVGFGRNATGGAEGCLYRVTNLNNSGAGSLRAGAEMGGRWIVFDVSGTITLSSNIDVRANTTIDGRGASITIRRGGLYMVNRPNVIISHLTLREMLREGQDAIQIRTEGTTDIWVNHVTISEVADGYIDITQGATNVTVSSSRLDPSPGQEHEKVMLIGANDPGDNDANTRVTLYQNFFNNTQQRNPLLRAGRVHMVNNYIRGWNIYGAGVGSGGQLLTERNIYDYSGYHRARAFTPWGSGPASIRSTGDFFLGGASGVESNASGVFTPPYTYTAATATSALASQISTTAGFQQVPMTD